MIICERCYGRLEPHEKFVRLGHIVDVRADGEPVFVFAYLHSYDEASGGCVGAEPAAA